MYFCHITASSLLTYASVAFYTLHYGSIRCLVASKNSSTHVNVANLRYKHTGTYELHWQQP